MILALRTDKPEAELYVLESDGSQAAALTWQAHRELSDTIFHKLDELLERADTSFPNLSGIIVYAGPGSFTGLRIGITVANTLSYSLGVPVVGTHTDEWMRQGLQRLAAGENDRIVKPEYGGEANITKPRK